MEQRLPRRAVFLAGGMSASYKSTSYSYLYGIKYVIQIYSYFLSHQAWYSGMVPFICTSSACQLSWLSAPVISRD